MNPFLTLMTAGALLSVTVLRAGPAPAPGETAFTADKQALVQEGPARKPLVLKIAVNDIYCHKTACECLDEVAVRSFDTVLATLKSRHDITLEVTYFMDVFDLHKAIQSGKYDGALCKPWSALQYSGRKGARFMRVADLLDPYNKPFLTGVFLTLPDSPIKQLADVQGKRIAVGKATAYEKHQEPMKVLAAAKVKPSETKEFSSCSENLSALMDGEVDVAVVSDYALTASCAVDFAEPADFRKIAATGKLPLTSLLVDLNKVSAGDAARLQAALLEVSGDKVPKDLDGKGFVLPMSWKPVLPTVPASEKPSGKAE